MPRLSRMKAKIAEERARNGEPPAKFACCDSAIANRHTRTCPRGGTRPISPEAESGDIAELLRQIQGHPKRKGK
jgi:hypothetical protein